MKKLLAVILLLVAINGIAQPRISDHNTIGWYTTSLTKSLDSSFSITSEYHWRRVHIIKDPQQTEFRIGVNYRVHPQVSFYLSYAAISTYPYGEHTVAGIPEKFTEQSIGEQMTITSKLGKINLSQRVRLEQRWVNRHNLNAPDQTVFLNRFRYMPRFELPVKKWYGAFYDEIFIGFGKNVGENVFDQTRMALLLGHRFSKHIRLEGGYFNQVLQLNREINNSNVFQYNNGLIINSFISL
jgi:hypothetical protein